MVTGGQECTRKRTRRLMWGIVAAVLVLAAAAARASGGLNERWATGLWYVVGVSRAGEPVAVSVPTLSERDRSGGNGDLPLRVFVGTKSLPSGALDEMVITGGSAQNTFSFKVYRVFVDGAASLIVPAFGGPALLRCPGRELYIFAAANSLWSVDLGGKVTELTPGRAGAYDRSRRFAPGTGPLLWALDPVPSPDGARLVYHSNREAVLDGIAGQSLWMCDPETGGQTQVLCQAGAGYRAHGWLGPESLVMTDENHPELGYGILDIGSGRTRSSDVPGAPLAVIPQTGTVVVSIPGAEPGESRFVAVDSDGRARDLAAAPAGYALVQFALPSPDGGYLLIQLWQADGPGLLGVVDLKSGALVDTWAPPQGYHFDGPSTWVGGSAVTYGVTDFRTRTSETFAHVVRRGGVSR